MDEAAPNVGVVCPDHAPKPMNAIDLPDELAVGWFVKIGFEVPIHLRDEDGAPTMEHMWVKITKMEGDLFEGELNSNPICLEVDIGSDVTFNVSEIEEVLPPVPEKRPDARA